MELKLVSHSSLIRRLTSLQLDWKNNANVGEFVKFTFSRFSSKRNYKSFCKGYITDRQRLQKKTNISISSNRNICSCQKIRWQDGGWVGKSFVLKWVTCRTMGIKIYVYKITHWFHNSILSNLCSASFQLFDKFPAAIL